MAYIKKLVMAGFKSFARRTEILFDQGVNVILGPNGSGKSNISDALCFVLGRLSIKSMRAAKAKNLLFMGSKYIKPAREAYVELVFDNSDKTFSIDKHEVVISRSVKFNGQSNYKINGENKTRAEIIEMLAQAGIDPHGFNLILQGQIQSIVRMHPEERRKIIEEVAGISIYESRKEKSLHELEKTDEKLKEIGAILRERTAYLKNLDKERTQALKFKELELSVKRCKASILRKRLEDKAKELESITKSIEEKDKGKEKIRVEIDKLRIEIDGLGDKIRQINKNIEQASGLEQETLHGQIANLKAELEGLKVRKENYENRKHEIETRMSEMQKSIPDLTNEITELRKESPMVAKKAAELKKKKEEFAIVEEERNKLYAYRTEMHSLREITKDKEKQISRNLSDCESLLRYLEEHSASLIYKDSEECSKHLGQYKQSIIEVDKLLTDLHHDELQHSKVISVSEFDIQRQFEIKDKVKEIDVCPLCQSKITESHIHHVSSDAESKINHAQQKLDDARDRIVKITEKRKNVDNDLRELRKKISVAENELMKHQAIKDRKEQMKRLVEHEKVLKEEVRKLEERRKNLEMKLVELPKIEERYDSKMLEIEEISSRTEEDVNTSLLYKERDLENIQNVIKRSKKDFEDILGEIKNIDSLLEEKRSMLLKKEEQEKELNARFKKMFENRDNMQRESQEKSIELSQTQNELRQIEDQVNYLKVGKARLDAEHEAITMEMADYPSDIEFIQASLNALQERMQKAQEALMQIGSINMRALEVYDEIKKEYDAVSLKVETLEKEKLEIMKIIEEIDKKKIRSFMKTFKAMNDLFTTNFAKLSSKGTAFLEIENKEDMFAGGVNIVVKLAKGKYFDVTSLSGGEQTLVALSLLFAIQEYKPYHFYIFDEIDAALDKRNSERLAGLLHQYMKAGQYIIITHNDAIIMNAQILYGVSMHDGVSKVLSLQVQEARIKEELAPMTPNNEDSALTSEERGDVSLDREEEEVEEAPLRMGDDEDEEEVVEGLVEEAAVESKDEKNAIEEVIEEEQVEEKTESIEDEVVVENGLDVAEKAAENFEVSENEED